MRKSVFKILFDVSYFIAGAVIYSISVNVFLSPNEISPGGFTGVAAVINHITQIPTGTMLFIFNIPILVLYPGKYEDAQLKLFNKLKPNSYYRAFNII